MREILLLLSLWVSSPVTYSVPSTERLLNAKHFSRLPPKRSSPRPQFYRRRGEDLRRLRSSPLRPVQGAECFAQLEGKRRGDIGVGDHFNVGALICFRGAFERII